MKIYFRYLFVRLLIPFVVCLSAGMMIMVMADLYGNISNFLDNKASLGLILWYYTLRVPIMLVQILPGTMLFSALWTLLGLNRRSELVAFQAGGMAPLRLFSPFFLFAGFWMIIYGIVLAGPAAEAQVTCERLLQEVKGKDNTVFQNFPYVDTVNRRIWFFQKLYVSSGKVEGLEILFRDAQRNDMYKYFAHSAKWNGEFWKLSGVREIIYTPGGDIEKNFEEVDLDSVTTPPRQLSLIISEAPELTVSQLSQYIRTSTSTQEHLAQFRTEWWYRLLHPLGLIVLLLFALLNGMHTNRLGTAAGVAWTIAVLFSYYVSVGTWTAFGQHNRTPPFVAAFATEFLFGALGLHLLALKYGWYWQVWHYWKKGSPRPVEI